MNDVTMPERTLRLMPGFYVALAGLHATLAGIDLVVYHARFPDRLALAVSLTVLNGLLALIWAKHGG